MAKHQLATLPHLWRHWLQVVTLFATRAPGRVSLDRAEYAAKHQALLQVCQALAADAGPGLRGRLQALEQLVRPWLSAASLENAERQLLVDLLVRCRRVEQALLPARRRYLAWLLLPLVAMPLLVLGAAAWSWLPLREVVASLWRAVRLNWREAPELSLWLVGGGVVVVASIMVISAGRAPR
jgi:hypothetical protein